MCTNLPPSSLGRCVRARRGAPSAHRSPCSLPCTHEKAARTLPAFLPCTHKRTTLHQATILLGSLSQAFPCTNSIRRTVAMLSHLDFIWIIMAATMAEIRVQFSYNCYLNKTKTSTAGITETGLQYSSTSTIKQCKICCLVNSNK